MSVSDRAPYPELHLLEIVGNAIVGGMESYVLNLLRHLPKTRYRVTVLSPFESAFTAALRALGCSVFITPFGDDPPWASIQLGVQLVREEQIDLIHAHLPNGHALGGVIGGLTGTPTVATIHGLNLTAQELGIHRTTGTHLIVVCQASYMQALALGISPERVTLIPNGVDTEIFSPRGDGSAFRRAINVPTAAPLIGFVGRLDWEKGPDFFLLVAEKVHQFHPDAHFCLVGEGPLEEAARHRIAELQLTNHAHLAGLWEDISQVYPAFDLLVQTSRSEGMPLVLLEAMACGVPVVAMAAGGVAELVESGVSGIVAGAEDWIEVVNAVASLMTHREKMERMGQAARARVEQKFNIRESARLTDELFQHLVQSRTELPNWGEAFFTNDI